MLKVRITPAALADIQDGMDFYNSRQYGLGDSFEEVVARYIDAVAQQPESGILYKQDIRYRIIPRFPFLLFYQHNKETVTVLRVFNTYLNPERISL